MSLHAQQTYDQLAPDYDRRWAHYTEATLQTTLEGLEEHRWGRVLDLAAGTGELIERMAERDTGLHIFGLDISRGMLMQSTRKSLTHSWNPVQGDAARLPFVDGSFDAVFCTTPSTFSLNPRQYWGRSGECSAPAGL